MHSDVEDGRDRTSGDDDTSAGSQQRPPRPLSWHLCDRGGGGAERGLEGCRADVPVRRIRGKPTVDGVDHGAGDRGGRRLANLAQADDAATFMAVTHVVQRCALDGEACGQ